MQLVAYWMSMGGWVWDISKHHMRKRVTSLCFANAGRRSFWAILQHNIWKDSREHLCLTVIVKHPSGMSDAIKVLQGKTAFIKKHTSYLSLVLRKWPIWVCDWRRVSIIRRLKHLGIITMEANPKTSGASLEVWFGQNHEQKEGETRRRRWGDVM